MEPQDERRWVLEWSPGTKPLPQTTSHSAFPLNSASDHSVIVSSCDCRVNSPDHIWRKPFWVSVITHWEKVAITAAPELLQLCCGILPCRVELLPGYLMNTSFPGGLVGKESACNTVDPGSIPGWGRSPGERNGYPLQYSCLGNPLDKGAWWATVHGPQRVGHDLVTKPPDEWSWTK